MEKMHIHLRRLCAVALSAMLTITTLCATLPAAAADVGYNGRLLQIDYLAGSKLTWTEKDNSDLSPVPSQVLSLTLPEGMDAIEPGYSEGDYAPYLGVVSNSGVQEALDNGTYHEFDEGKALMFYIKMPAGHTTKLHIHGWSFAITEEVGVRTAGSTASIRLPGSSTSGVANPVYYLLESGSSVWQEADLLNFDSGAVRNSSQYGSIDFEAGFEGWVRIPATSFYNYAANKNLHRLDFYFNHLLEDDEIQVSGIMTVDNPDNDFTSVTLDDGSKYDLTGGVALSADLLDITGVNGNDYYLLNEGDGFAQNYALIDGDDAHYDVSVTGDEGSVDIPRGEAAKVSIMHVKGNETLGSVRLQGSSAIQAEELGFKFTNQSKNAFNGKTARLLLIEAVASEDKINEDARQNHWKDGVFTNLTGSNDNTYNIAVNTTGASWEWNADRALIFYATTTGTVETRFYLGTGKNMTGVAAGTTYYRLNLDGKNQWEDDVAAAVGETSMGDIVLPAGFKGWVMIPASGFKQQNGSGEVDETTGQITIRIYPRTLGGDYGALEIGLFLTSSETIPSDVLTFDDETYWNFNQEQVAVESNETNFLNATMYTATDYRVRGGTGTNNGSLGYKADIQSNRPTPAPVTGSFTSAVLQASDALTVDESYIGTYWNDGVYENWTQVNGNAFCSAVTLANATWNTDGALMFYVSSTGTVSTKLHIAATNGGFLMRENMPYYTLNTNGTNEWETQTTELSGTNMGDMVIPAGFKGWIMVPSSVFKTAAGETGAVTGLRVFPRALGGDYGEMLIGWFMVVDSNVPSDMISFDEGDTVTDFDGKPVDPSSSGGSYNVTIADGAFTTDGNIGDAEVTATINAAGEISADGRVMFWLKAGDKTNMSVAFGEYGLVSGKEVYLNNMYDRDFAAVSVDENGSFAIDAGFEGWVIIPAASLNGTGAFLEIKVFFSDIKEGASIGSFVTGGAGNYDLDAVEINGKKVPLIIKLYDANADESVDILDLVRAKKNAVGEDKLYAAAIDTDGDGAITGNELIAIRQALLAG